MAKNAKDARQSLPRNIYGDEIGAYIEECRQFVARARRQEVIVEDSAARVKARRSAGKGVSAGQEAEPADKDISARQEELNKLEADLCKRELELIERELKCYALQQEVSRLRSEAQAYKEIETFVDRTLETLAQTIDRRDPLTAGHSIRVTRYSLLIGEALKLGEADRQVLRYAAMMHDYGKIGVPEAILWKNGRLTPEEYALVQTHARITYELLSNLPFTRRLVEVPFIASCHHEKLDGSGYYRGLKGEEIPFLARVITVADVFDALTSVRHYRNRMDITKVTEIMESGRENHFDPEIIDAFFNLPCQAVLKVMESERGQSVPMELELFGVITWQRLVELCAGARPAAEEEGLKELFERIYFAGLPSDYQALD